MIEPNASSDEFSSPFFQENEKICRNWEDFAKQNNGTISGTYNSWSYKLFIKIDQPNVYRIIVSKATYSSGNLLLSTKYQSLQEHITIQLKTTASGAFKIKRASWRELFSGKISRSLEINPYYSIIGKRNSSLIEKISTLLKDHFKAKRVMELHLKDGILTIKLNNSNHDFERIQALVDAPLH